MLDRVRVEFLSFKFHYKILADADLFSTLSECNSGYRGLIWSFDDSLEYDTDHSKIMLRTIYNDDDLG